MSRPGIFWFGLIPALGLWLALITVEGARFEGDLSARASARVREKLGETAFVTAKGRDLRLEGLIFDESARAGAVAAAAAIPGARLVSDALTAPAPLAPYAWRAVRDGAALILSGGAPSPADRAALVAAAKQALPGVKIVDEMAYASGAPPGFAAQAAKILPALAHLQSGEAFWRGGEMALAGQAATQADYRAALDAAAGLAATPEIAPPPAAHFAFEAENDGRNARLAGLVGSETDRAALLAEARRAFPDAKIADALQLASGAPPRFAAEAAYALRALGRLKEGRVSLSGHQARLSGLGRPGMDATAFAAALPSEPGVILDVKGVAAGDISPYAMSAEKSAKALALSGFCGDEESCAKIRAEIVDKFAGLALTDSLRPAPGAPKGFATAAREGLGQLARLRVGRLALRDASAHLDGDAVRATTADEVKAALVAAMPDGFALQADITGAEREVAAIPPSKEAPPPPEPAPAPKEAASPPPAPAPQAAAPPPPAPTSPAASPPPPASPNLGAPRVAALPQAVAAPAPAAPPKPEADCRAGLGEKARAAAIQFDYGSAEVTPDTATRLDGLAAAAKKCPGAALEISGHADAVGRMSRNLALSWRRAESVAAYLLAAGVEPQRLRIEGFGEAKPSAPNDSDGNRAKNRRIEIQVK